MGVSRGGFGGTNPEKGRCRRWWWKERKIIEAILLLRAAWKPGGRRCKIFCVCVSVCVCCVCEVE